MGPEALAQVLRPLRELFRPADYPDLLVGLEVADDAAVYRLSPEIAVIQTLDFFTPIVDDPYAYGAIAAANAMSDIYAMGGEVTLALNIAAFPPKLPPEIVSEILRGGGDKVREAGGVLAGGHTIDDEEPKYGLSVMGVVHPERILAKGGARPGDALVLTKPLGVGIVTTAAKGDAADPAHVAEAIASMERLNRVASRLAREEGGVHAVTDVTGFGILGHADEMAEKGGVRLRFSLGHLPFVAGAREYADQWLFPAGTCSNETFYQAHVTFGPGVSEEEQQLLYTPETSGGLLIAVAPERLEGLLAAFRRAEHTAWAVGEVLEGEGVEVLAE
jgi:selenide,water dikinase